MERPTPIPRIANASRSRGQRENTIPRQLSAARTKPIAIAWAYFPRHSRAPSELPAKYVRKSKPDWLSLRWNVVAIAGKSGPLMTCRTPVSKKTGCKTASERRAGLGFSDDSIASAALDTRSLGVGRAGRFANNQFRPNRDDVGERRLSPDPLQQNAGGYLSHLSERLTDGGQAGIVERGSLHIVEAHDRNISWNLEAVITAGADRADSGDVVVTNDCREVCSALQ